ncbi:MULTISPECIES: HNH endonuclease [Vibrio]
MWFQLARADSNEAMFDKNFQASFEDQIKQSREDSSAERRKRLKQAAKNPKPRKRVVSTVVYDRNPDVVAEVLERAKGYCEAEKCRNPEAPFVRKKDGTPYLEVHHKIRLADGGDDTVENAIALCPNCHRNVHYG